jgi:DNA-binding transcriptional MocR family regulator
MSWRLIGPAWKVPDLTMAERIVLLALVSFTDKRGANAYPSIATLSVRCCCSRRTVQRALTGLCKRGVIQAEGKGRKGTIRYRVQVTQSNGVGHTDRRVGHSGMGASVTESHNPSKVIPGDYPSNYPSDGLPADSYFDSGSRQKPSSFWTETVSEQAQRLNRERRQRK